MDKSQSTLLIHADKLLPDWEEWSVQEPESYYITSEKTMDLRMHFGVLQQKNTFYRFQAKEPFGEKWRIPETICVETWEKYVKLQRKLSS